MKIAKNHTTKTEATDFVIKHLLKTTLVDKVSPSIIRNTRSKTGQKSLKISEINGGLKIVIRGNGAVQDLYVYTKKQNKIKVLLKKIFK